MITIHQGIDIMEIGKFRRIALGNPGFIADIFTEYERGYCLSLKDSLLHFAGRFVAKEACMKALGIGLSLTGTFGIFKCIEVITLRSGKPALSLTGWASKVSRKRGMYDLSISISHSADYVVSSVIFLARPREQDLVQGRKTE